VLTAWVSRFSIAMSKGLGFVENWSSSTLCSICTSGRRVVCMCVVDNVGQTPQSSTLHNPNKVSVSVSLHTRIRELFVMQTCTEHWELSNQCMVTGEMWRKPTHVQNASVPSYLMLCNVLLLLLLLLLQSVKLFSLGSVSTLLTTVQKLFFLNDRDFP